jgi:PKD domain
MYEFKDRWGHVFQRRHLVSIIGVLAIVAFGTPCASAQELQQQVRFVPDVVGQFNALTRRPDALGFHIGGGPDPSQCRHHQALIRTEAADGTPYFIVTRSGPPRDTCLQEELGIEGNPIANLYIVRMGSRDKNGERLRSNRLRRNFTTTLTPPEAEDVVVRSIPYDGTGVWPHYDHPGGMQQVGNIVAVGVEFPARILVDPGPPAVWVQEDPNAPAVLVQFLDVTDPENPQIKSTFVPTEPGVRAGVVAVTPCGAGRAGLPCATGHYLMAITGGNNATIHFYESTTNDLGSPHLWWNWLYTWHRDEVIGGDWHSDHQTIQFLREGNLSGALYLAGARGGDQFFGEDFMDLYRVDLDGSTVRLTWVSSRHMISQAAGEGETAGATIADFAAASTFHVSPSGELLFYAAEHDNDGPKGSNDRKSVKMGEWRHEDMVRPNSPTLAPSIATGGPYVVDEGGSVVLSALGRPPITRAWIQLFEDPNYSDRNVAVDYDDWDKDDFDNFERLDPGFIGDVNGATDEASSWRWFAPKGCTLRVNEHAFDDSRFPGSRTRTLIGAGLVKEKSDLDAVLNDDGDGFMDDKISSMQFSVQTPRECDAYYNAPIGVAWDLDLNGVFETSGGNPAFSAGELDGPGLRSVAVRAQHPSDQTSLGQSAPATVDVQIRNVAPTIASFTLVDSLGLRVGLDVPFAFTNLEYTAAASFTDPGKPDHQTATLNLGDGTIVSSSGFDVFSDAFGGATGQLRQRHIFRDPGTYMIRLDVTDDDGGLTSTTVPITVVSPIEAVESIVDEIDLLLAGATNPQVISALREARDSLDGNNNGLDNNGAVDKLASGDHLSALVKIKDAIKALERAEAAGSGDLSRLKYLLALTGEAIAQGVYLDAVAAIEVPTSGEAMQLQRIRQSITNGHIRLVDSLYVAAIEEFRDAVGRAMSLL